MHSYMQYIRYGYGYMLLFFFLLLAGWLLAKINWRCRCQKIYESALPISLYTYAHMHNHWIYEYYSMLALVPSIMQIISRHIGIASGRRLCVSFSFSHNFLCETSIETVCECVSVVEAIEYIAPMNMQQNRCCSTFNANNVEYTLIKKWKKKAPSIR